MKSCAGLAMVGLIALAGSVGPAAAEYFDPYAAVQDGMSIDQAVPLIEVILGPMEEPRRVDDRLQSSETSPAVISQVRNLGPQESLTAAFLFCDGVLAAFRMPVPQEVAYAIAEAVDAGLAEEHGNASPRPTFEITEHVTKIVLGDGRTALAYGFGEQPLAVHPHRVFLDLKLESFCAGEREY